MSMRSDYCGLVTEAHLGKTVSLWYIVGATMVALSLSTCVTAKA
jgi:hypothetical protein